MNAENLALLNSHAKPGLLLDEEVSCLTGIPHGMLYTVAKSGALRPLCWPLPKNATRLWSRVAVERFNSDESKQETARRAMLKQNKDKNNSRKSPND